MRPVLKVSKGKKKRYSGLRQQTNWRVCFEEKKPPTLFGIKNTLYPYVDLKLSFILLKSAVGEIECCGTTCPTKTDLFVISRKDLLWIVQIYCDRCLIHKALDTWKQTNQCPQPSWDILGVGTENKQVQHKQASKKLYDQSERVLNTVHLILTCNFLGGALKRCPGLQHSVK